MEELRHPVKVRSHHLLCMLGFRGLGYGEVFILNMAKLVGKLHSDSTFPILLVVGCDVICAACPHNKEGRCLEKADSEAKTASLDLKMLLKLGIEAETQLSAGEAWERIKERITSEDMAEICQDCEWWGLGYCAEGLERLKAKSK